MEADCLENLHALNDINLWIPTAVNIKMLSSKNLKYICETAGQIFVKARIAFYRTILLTRIKLKIGLL